MPNSKRKPKKPGRPPLPKGSAKAVMLRVRITPEEHASFAKAAKASKQTVSAWIRSTLLAGI
jgi:predicted HicB family RNase H-like nuclease